MEKKERFFKFWMLIPLNIIVIFFIPAILSYTKWGHFYFFNSIEQWGQYGDFIGGVLNPILTFANMFLLAFITWKLNEIEEERIKRATKEEKNRLKLEQIYQDKRMKSNSLMEDRRLQQAAEFDNKRLLNEFRYDAYKRIVEYLDSNDRKNMLDTKGKHYYYVPINLELMKDYFDQFYQNTTFLFFDTKENYKDVKDKLNNSLDDLIDAVNLAHISFDEDGKKYDDFADYYMTDEIFKAFNNFGIAKNNFKVFMQMVMIDFKQI